MRLLHRRRGWAWTAGGSLIGLAVYTIAGVALFQGLTGTPGLISVAVLPVLLALGVAALIVVVVDTVRLHRTDPAVRSAALGRTSHYPLRAHAYRYPPRHGASWIFGWFMLVMWLIIAVVFLPGLVDSAAYLTGLSPKAAFVPVTYGQACSRSGCSTVTEGYLQGSGTQVTWDGQVPLDRPFPVREPVWAWGLGRDLIDGTGSAIGLLVMSLLFESVGVLVVTGGVIVARNVVHVRRQRAAHAGL